MNILVCGGAGYIGSHVVKMFHQAGHRVVTFDNLSTGHHHAVKWGGFERGDLLDAADLNKLFQAHRFDAVMHFSARSLVSESMTNPSLYYRNNVVGTYKLLEAMRNQSIGKIIFSSSAAVYGNPKQERIDENHSCNPINPYGRTKLIVEQMLADYAEAYGMDSVSLRYFNAAGADPDGELGEEHEPETHLIPNILKAALGRGPELKLFGDDHDTRDGTCVRDYIHIHDLCAAHLKALEYLSSHSGAYVFNLGNGNGFSVKEVLQAAEQVMGQSIPYTIAGHRSGDPATLVADASRARNELGWQPRYTDIRTIIADAWRFHRTRGGD